MSRTAALAAIALAAGCGGASDGPPPGETEAHDTAGAAPPAVPMGVTRVEVETTKGELVIAVHPEWAPIGAGRFLELVRSGYYDDARFHRVVPDFIVQWGLAGDPALTAAWHERFIADDPVVATNTRGRIAFAFNDPGTRSTQVYINLVDNVRLDSTGFAPFGEVVEGMDVVDALYSGYGETSGGGLRRGDQQRIVEEGNAYLDRAFPRLDRLLEARVVGAADSGEDGGRGGG